MKKYHYLYLLPLLLSFSCNTDKEMEAEQASALPENRVELTDEQFKNTKMETGVLSQKEVSTLLNINGIIEVPPQNLISISVPLGGYIQSTHLLEGMQVKKGEIIATIEDQQYIEIQQDYLTAKIRLNAFEKEFTRQKELNENKAGSDKVFENAQSDYLSQKVLVKSLAEKLKLIGINPEKLNENGLSRRISILSPINGYVSRVNTNIGKYVTPADVLFDLVNPADIHLALSVFEKDIHQLSIGQKLVSFTNSEPDKKYHAKIILIGKDVSKDRVVTIHCHFDKYEPFLIPGMYMNAELETKVKTGYVIPDEGIVRFEGKYYLYEVTADKSYEMREVLTHGNEGGQTLITFQDNSSPVGRTFVTKGAYTLLMKMKNMEEE
ncbi:MAG: efflux RND transporter periplasmic adaptor subunit [Saprospiraceae bacterium]|nr:efflux RND transporter periplasmic adaptor subunit [Saprospiraceae bacterium]MDP4811999.1 efflux RND transporter periplasmic adaptor subunit [Saprospiraceae bacterium]MDP4813150.1 efflux RND transporter periplasmic adaptor subunit [Saprospiraceae bacterium]MDP5047708.1 efflux RND transporter periplasmic adaptor subunit [Saprospiraceae bacterium]